MTEESYKTWSTLRHWKERISHTDSDMRYATKCHNGTEGNAGTLLKLMLYWKNIIKLAYIACPSLKFQG